MFRIVVKLGRPLPNFFGMGSVKDTVSICSTVKVSCPCKHRNSENSAASHLIGMSPPLPISECNHGFGGQSVCPQHHTSSGHIFLHSALGSCLDTAQRWGAVPCPDTRGQRVRTPASPFSGQYAQVFSVLLRGCWWHQPLLLASASFAHSSDRLKWRLLLPCSFSFLRWLLK